MTKVVLITGSSGGVGVSLVRVFLSSGYVVIGLDKKILGAPRGGGGESCLYELECDLNKYSTDEPYRRRIIKLITAAIPNDTSCFSIIHTAAIQDLHSLDGISADVWQCAMNVNVLSLLLLVKDFNSELGFLT